VHNKARSGRQHRPSGRGAGEPTNVGDRTPKLQNEAND